MKSKVHVSSSMPHHKLKMNLRDENTSERTFVQLIFKDARSRTEFLPFGSSCCGYWELVVYKKENAKYHLGFSFCLQRVSRKKLNNTYPNKCFCYLKVQTEEKKKKIILVWAAYFTVIWACDAHIASFIRLFQRLLKGTFLGGTLHIL